jgi:hypothetical protein
MRGETGPGFQLSLAISLKMLPRHLVKDAAAAKIPHESDNAIDALAAGIVDQLRLSGWTITAPPAPPLDRGM